MEGTAPEIGREPGLDFLANQGGDRPVITVADQLRILDGRTFRGTPSPESPAIEETVILCILGDDEMELCAVKLGSPNALQNMKPKVGSVNLRSSGGPISLVGPAVGAPRAGTLCEYLKFRGVKTVVGLGWCGAVHPDVRVGDLVLAESVVREEGTSHHYLPSDANPLPSVRVNDAIRGAAERRGVELRQGTVWTTDAPFRETRSKVSNFADRGVLGVDMETSALVSLGEALGIDVGVLLVVSDELWGSEWNWGVPTPEFAAGRDSYIAVATDAAAALAAKVRGQRPSTPLSKST